MSQIELDNNSLKDDLNFNYAIKDNYYFSNEKSTKDAYCYDDLTGLYNNNFLRNQSKIINKKKDLSYSILTLDIDRLEIINLIFGRDKGNKVLIETAKVLKSINKPDGFIARTNGDSFTILLLNTGKDEAKKFKNIIIEAFNDKKDNKIPTNINIGQATKKKQNENFLKVLNRSIDNLYTDKIVNGNKSEIKILSYALDYLESMSRETCEHSFRMIFLAQKLGKKLNLDNKMINKLSMIAIFHDIGKLHVNKEILNNPTELNKNEWANIIKHPEIGAEILSETKSFNYISKEILHHHERWDGKGYPRGLKGKTIPFLSRIIAIVDAYDVMTNKRPYCPAKTKREALCEIKRCAGTQFDPDLTSIFVELFDVNSKIDC